jgi:hypothetical protein
MAVAVRSLLALNRPLAAFSPEGGLFLLQTVETTHAPAQRR